MNIKTVLASELIPYARNPRKNDQAVDAVAASIKEFGFKQPIVVDKDNVVVAGHTRLKAAQKLGIESVPVVVADDLTPEQIKAYRILDNKVGEKAEWDFELLKLELDEMDLNLEDFDVEFGVLDLEVITEIKEDDYELPSEDKIQTKIQLGDLITIGQHRLLCGDSTDAESVAYLMDGKKAEMLFTSPPYSDMREYNGNKNLSVDHLSQFISAYKNHCNYQVLNLGIQRKDHEIISYWDDYIKAAKESRLKFMAWNVWHKSGVSVGQQSAFIPIYHEWIFVFGSEFKHINRTVERKTDFSDQRNVKSRRQKDGSIKFSSVGDCQEKKEMESVFYSNPELGKIRESHPATFPIDLPSEYIKAITNTGDIITDPFLGSGTTMVAAHQLSRTCYGMEIDRKYCQVIVDRMRKLDPSLEVTTTGELHDNQKEETN